MSFDLRRAAVIGVSLHSGAAMFVIVACSYLLGVFALQWGVGLAIDLLRSHGWSTLSAYRRGFAVLAGCCVFSYVWFLCLADHAVAPKLHQPE